MRDRQESLPIGNLLGQPGDWAAAALRPDIRIV